MARKVLVVDESAEDRQRLSALLGSAYNLIEAESGAEGLGILTRHFKALSAVVLEWNLPDMSAVTFLEMIQKNGLWRQLPVIVACREDGADRREEAFLRGVNGFVAKPYRPALTLHTLQNCISLRETAAIVNAVQRDRLTGLYNRETFFDLAEKMIHRQKPGYYVLSCFDIDGFKVVNDQYGMEIGDQVLKHIAASIGACMERQEGVCCRFMADKFALLYPAACTRLSDIEQTHKLATTPACVNRKIKVRIGRYLIDDLTLSISAMYDRAMLAQESIKGRYDVYIAQYEETMRDRLLHEQRIVTEMYDALRSGQFEPWFQPQYNHATGALVGAEALVRWRHPKDGLLVPPGDFIPVFERNGFIYELDKFVWEKICALLRQWLDQGRAPVPVSLNISRYDVFHKHFFSVITGLVRKYEIPLHLLHLEITESAFAESTEQIVSTIKSLIAYGFTVEIDDFGSGYSSLNTLKDVPATILKLDMKFLENKEDSKRGGNILESVVRMAKWLGMSVIAEGVETKEQADYLKSIGCFYMQGYYYARPMPAADYEALLLRSRLENRTLRLETVENLDNNAFWDPRSMETLIFNSYVGGASIIEYHNGVTEAIRMNDRFQQEFGGKTIGGVPVCQLKPEECLDEANLALMNQNIRQAIETRRESACEITVSGLDGGAEDALYLRCTVRVIAMAEDRYLLYCSVSNVTALKETSEHLRFLNQIAHGLLERADVQEGIRGTLEKLLTYFHGKRAYIFELDAQNATASNTYEVCAKGVSSEMARLQGIPQAVMPFWLHAFDKQNYCLVEDVDALDDSREAERELLRLQGIQSLIAIPLKRDGRLIGFMGIDDGKRQRALIKDLVALGDYIAVMLTRRDLQFRIQSDNEQLAGLLKDMPGGFARLRVAADGALLPEYLNHSFCRAVNMKPSELSTLYGRDAMDYVHPDDAEGVRSVVREMLKSGEPCRGRHRLRTREGGYAPLTYLGRATRGLNGEATLNVFFVTDMPLVEGYAEAALPAVLSSLLESATDFMFIKDNVPGGLAMYQLSPRGLCLLYCNDGYFSVTGYTQKEYEQAAAADPLCLVYKEDRKTIQSVLARALAGESSFSYEYRALRKDGDYRWLSARGVVSHRQGDTVVCNVLKLDVTERKQAEEALRLNEEQYRIAAEIGNRDVARFHIKEGVFYSHHNPFLSELFGDAIPNAPRAIVDAGLIAEGSVADFMDFCDCVQKGRDNCSVTVLARVKGGDYRWYAIEATLLYDEAHAPTEAIIVYYDVTEQRERERIMRQNEQMLRAQAEKDGLTGTYNKKTTETLIRKRLMQGDGEPFALLIADMDNLKHINDTYGHPEGDKAIRLVGETLNAQSRRMDVTGRVGGDEFIIFLDGLKERSKIEALAQRLVQKISALHVGEDVPLSVSIGVTTGEMGAHTFEELYRQADKALYFAKRNGKRQFAFYAPDIQA